MRTARCCTTTTQCCRARLRYRYAADRRVSADACLQWALGSGPLCCSRGCFDMASVSRPTAVIVFGTIVLGSVTAPVVGAAAKSVSGVVRSLTDRSPVTATEVRIDAGHFDTTTDSGL